MRPPLLTLGVTCVAVVVGWFVVPAGLCLLASRTVPTASPWRAASLASALSAVEAGPYAVPQARSSYHRYRAHPVAAPRKSSPRAHEPVRQTRVVPPVRHHRIIPGR